MTSTLQLSDKLKGYTKVNPPVGCLLLFLAAIFSVPYLIVVSILMACRERRLFRRLVQQNRVVSWDDVEQNLIDGRGTLIIEQAQKQGLRLWWTPEDVSSIEPCFPPDLRDLEYIFAEGVNHPFVVWCYERYLSSQTGSALLSRPHGLTFPPGFLSPDFFTTKFPAARFVSTVLTPDVKTHG